LKMLEETIPSAHIVVTSSEEPEKIAAPLENSTYAELKPSISTLYNSFRKNGYCFEETIQKLMVIEPFNSRPEYIELFKCEVEVKDD